ncbi:hypothetical protein CEP53_007256 [Fusarium sp. AF-6]|nr:hypothetical protein CEP53_007256 [Fusarium sp. AF-6]
MFFITIPKSLLSYVRKEVDQVVDNTTSQLTVPEYRCRSPDVATVHATPYKTPNSWLWIISYITLSIVVSMLLFTSSSSSKPQQR